MSQFAPPPIVPPSPLEYAPPPPARPSLITVIAVFSIIVGGLSALFSIGGIFSAAAMLFVSSVAVRPAVALPPATAPATIAIASPPIARPFALHVSRGASILTIATSVLSVGLAILLLIGGILILRNSPLASRLHWLFVWLKLPLIAVAAVATWWTYTEMMTSLNSLSTSPTPFPGFVGMMVTIQVVFRTVLSLIYPIVLLIVLSTRTWKDHFHSLQSGAMPDKPILR